MSGMLGMVSSLCAAAAATTATAAIVRVPAGVVTALLHRAWQLQPAGISQL
jgi:hypothetical protein